MTSEAIPEDSAIRDKIYSILQTIDIETMGIKSFIQLLSKEMKVSPEILKANKKDFIKQTLTEAINEGNGDNDDAEENGDDGNDDDDDDDDEEEEEDQKPSSSNGRGLAQKKLISNALARLLGKSTVKGENDINDNNANQNQNETNCTVMMARTEVVKELWNYIRQHQLQNPDNKREIRLDSAMQTVFGCTTFTMFTMNKYIGAHIDPFKPVDLTPKYKPARTTVNSGSKRSRTCTGTNGSAKKARKVGTQPPYLLSDALQAVVGTNVLPRPQVVSKLWKYIKDHDLQNPHDKREILCDDTLQRVFDNKNKISMFQMNKYIGRHFLEKVDKSQYHHHEDVEEDNGAEDDDDNEE